jgi:hypothetical protein
MCAPFTVHIYIQWDDTAMASQSYILGISAEILEDVIDLQNRREFDGGQAAKQILQLSEALGYERHVNGSAYAENFDAWQLAAKSVRSLGKLTNNPYLRTLCEEFDHDVSILASGENPVA